MTTAAHLPRFVGGERLLATCEERRGSRYTGRRVYAERGDRCGESAVAFYKGKALCFAHLARAGGSIPKCGPGCRCLCCERWRRLDRKAAVVT